MFGDKKTKTKKKNSSSKGKILKGKVNMTEILFSH